MSRIEQFIERTSQSGHSILNYLKPREFTSLQATGSASIQTELESIPFRFEFNLMQDGYTESVRPELNIPLPLSLRPSPDSRYYNPIILDKNTGEILSIIYERNPSIRANLIQTEALLGSDGSPIMDYQDIANLYHGYMIEEDSPFTKEKKQGKLYLVYQNGPFAGQLVKLDENGRAIRFPVKNTQSY